MDGVDLGSLYADIFVSCSPEDRRDKAAHYPALVVEIFSSHVGAEFTRKKEAYLRSARLTDYYIIDSTRRYVVRYCRAATEPNARLLAAEFYRGPVPVPLLHVTLTFEQIYAGTSVPAILHPLRAGDEESGEVSID